MRSSAYQIVDDVGVVVDCLVHHQAQDAHLCRAAVVELDRLLNPKNVGELSLSCVVTFNTTLDAFSRDFDVIPQEEKLNRNAKPLHGTRMMETQAMCLQLHALHRPEATYSRRTRFPSLAYGQATLYPDLPSSAPLLRR